MQTCLRETDYYNYSHPVVQDFLATVDRSQSADLSKKALAIDLYRRVRDGWQYSAYHFYTLLEDMCASSVMQRKRGHCLDKAVILITCYRAVGLPARLHLAKVANHIAVERLVELFGSAELTPHGYVEVFLDGKWVACTPAFNKQLCKMLKVDVLEFDGETDSVFQAFNSKGDQFMEYLDDYGSFEDFPRDFILNNLEEHYPKFRELRAQSDSFSLI